MAGIIPAAIPASLNEITPAARYYRGWLGPCVTSEAPAVFLNEINTCRNIKAMVSMAKQNGIQAILATLPPGAAQILKTLSSSGQTDRR
jgi:hypothetical protein